jgi:glycosyltransferase involved in cell wall biosynthesis
MRVLYFSRTYTIHDRRFLASLGESEHEVFFLRLENDPVVLDGRTLPPRVTEVHWDSNVASASFEDRMKFIPNLKRILQQVHPDLVHAGPVPTCGFMAAMTGFRPLLVMSWGSDLLVQADSTSVWNQRTRYALEHSDMLAVDSKTVGDKARQLVGYPSERIVQFPWGIDLDIFSAGAAKPDLRQLPGWDDSFVILSTRSWEPNYGTMWLLEAFRAARQINPRLKLALLGSGSLRGQVADFIRHNDLGAHVHTPGQLAGDDLVGYFRSADLFVNSAYSDGTSISLLEAMATELPVIVTDNASNREWTDGKTGGLLATFGEAAPLRDALLQIAAMAPQERRSWGAHNRKIVEQRGDWKKNFPLLLRAYARLVAANRDGERA